MLVDDEPIIRELFIEMAKIGGHEVVATARNGQEAVDTFKGTMPPPDLVLMDHRMPGKSGLDATREITAAHPGTKVLLVTADQTVLDKAEEGGALGYLEKPFSMGVLLEAIDEALAGKRVEVTWSSVRMRLERHAA